MNLPLPADILQDALWVQRYLEAVARGEQPKMAPTETMQRVVDALRALVAPPAPQGLKVYAVYRIDPARAIYIAATSRAELRQVLHGTPYAGAHVRNRTLVGGPPSPVPEFILPKDADALHVRLTAPVGS